MKSINHKKKRYLHFACLIGFSVTLALLILKACFKNCFLRQEESQNYILCHKPNFVQACHTVILNLSILEQFLLFAQISQVGTESIFFLSKDLEGVHSVCIYLASQTNKFNCQDFEPSTFATNWQKCRGYGFLSFLWQVGNFIMPIIYIEYTHTLLFFL